MDIHELETFDLADAVKFHHRLNPRIWGRDEQMLPQVRDRLLAAAADFQQFLGVPDLDLQDITVSGSNAAYSYTPHSDIDLHLVVRMPDDAVYRELFDAKKYQYNDQHDIRIGGADVELYVQDADQPHVSQGIYSIVKDQWISVPRRRKAKIDDMSVQHKYEDLGRRIEDAIATEDLATIQAMIDKIKQVRKTGLEDNGEFGAENLAYKALRTQGLLQALFDARNRAKDQLLSINERKKKKRAKPRVRYGFGGWFYPGYGFDSGATGDAGGGDGGGESMQEDDTGMAQGSEIGDDGAKSTWDGVSPDTQTFLSEGPKTEILRDFVGRTIQQLRLKDPPRVIFHKNTVWAKKTRSFGQYDPDDNCLHVSLPGRHVMDIMRTIAHELTHAKQHERYSLPDVAGETGSAWENSANAMAGIIMRDMAKIQPDLFETIGSDTDLTENWLNRAAAAAALSAAMSMMPAQAQDQEQPQQGTSLGQVLNTALKLYGISQIREPQARAEVEQEFKNYLRARQGDANAQNQSEIYQWERQQKLDEGASGYIPTKKQARDPRYSMALTVDIKPGEVGRQANKLGLKTDSQGRPDLLTKDLANALREFKETGVISERCWTGYRKQGMKKKGDRMVPNCVPVSEDEELTEVKMSPAEFQKFLRSPAAEGIRAGFEAELIFRDTQSDPDGGESEPDYDADERAYSIDDIIEFFTGGDGGIGPGTARRLQDQLMDAFSDYAQQQFADDYFDLARFQEWADDNVWPDVDDQYRDQARDDLGDEATDEQVEAEAVTLFRDDVERDWDRSGEWYNRAYEELYDEYYGDLDQSDWLDQADLRYMSNVAEEYGLDWPYWTDGSGSGGTRDWQEIANSLERVTGMPVRVSSGYHGAARRPGQYVIEPDGSLDSDDSDDYGLEVVSPPLPLPEALEQLRRIIDWANGPGAAYTNSSTGLHMGVSLPFKGGDVDPIKLILFMGDKNLLEMFGRESNSYARSAYERLESKIRSMKNAGPKQISGIMELMKTNLIELADRDLQRGVLGDKYVSVNPHDGYIEFRGPGGDYLAKSDEIDGVLENTMLRLAYAMSIAGDPAAHRQEYAKKLYKMLTGYRGAEISKSGKDTKFRTKIETEGENPFMRLFADYSAGTLTGEELKAKWADTVLAAERRDAEDDDLPDVPTGTPQEYEVYDRNTGEIYTTFRARDDDEAMDQFRQHHRAAYAQQGLPVLRVKGPVQREYEVVDRSTGTPGDQDSYKVIDTFSAANDTEAAEMAMNKWAGQGIDFVVRKKAREEPKSQKPKSRRAELAKRVTRSTRDVGEQLWRVNHHSSQRWVIARSQAEAVAKAVQQDRMFDSPETRARIATDLERQQWQLDQEARALRQRDSEQDAAQIRARLGAGQPAGGEFTGAWEIRDGQGRELHRFGGIGNSQADANRFAARWLGMFRPDLVGQEVDVVPVMRQGLAEGSLNEFSTGGGDDGEDPFDAYPCYDCGSTIFLHHTKSCELAEPNAMRDLPEHPGTQHWTGKIPKGLHPIPGLQEGVAEGLNEDATRAEAQAAYMQGKCMILAVAINQLNPERYPIGYIWEYNMSAGVPDMQLDDDEWESLSPQEQQEISKDISRHSVVHAYVRDRDTGEYIDARGRHKTLPNLWGRLGVTRFEEFPGTVRELIDITAHGDWDEVGEKVDFKRGQPAFDSLAGPAGVKRAQDYAVKYLGVEGSKNKAPGTDQQGVSEGQRR